MIRGLEAQLPQERLLLGRKVVSLRERGEEVEVTAEVDGREACVF